MTWTRVYVKIKNTLFSWKPRNFVNLKSRVFVLQCFALSQAWYVAQLFPPSQQIIIAIERLSRDFLFQGFLEKISYVETHFLINKGGLANPNFFVKTQALLISQIGRYLNAKNSNANSHLRYWIQISLPNK